ncbi:MAG: poly-gamma-glutamate biosynthesis protein [Chloroflexi bacterium]|nr:MAG: poly-gamma-glutamate biosynthesis protein [Chloroflexota bacterium]
MPRRITVTAAGDALITTRMPEYPDAGFQDLCGLIRGADVAFINMEMVLSNYEGVPVVEAGGGNASAHPAVALDLMRMGFNLTAYANNHTLNYGEYGCLKTLEVLAEYGFTCAGAGRHLAEARRPVYLDTAAGRVGLMGCASTFANGHRAGAQKHDTQGRPGLNPQRFETLFVVDQEHMDAIKRISERTGVAERQQHAIDAGWLKPPKREGEYHFAERAFIVGEEFGIRTEAHEKDLEGNAASIRQAAAVSHLALASIHAHEQGKGQEDPADFLVQFAHAMIDAGAGMVIGHGHHAMRGLELYKGKPIFYSLGDFIFQVELMRQAPSDDYEGLGVDTALDAGQLFNQLFNESKAGFGSDRKYWETVLPICVFEDGELVELTLYPVTLGFGEPLPDRGIPRLATGALAGEILTTFANLSAPFGTTVEVDGPVGRVRL